MIQSLKSVNSFLRYDLENISIIASSPGQTKNELRYLLLRPESNELLITFNLDFYQNTEKFPYFREICRNAPFVFPDGYGIIQLLKIKQGITAERITGHMLFEILLDLANELKLRVAFAGATADSLDKTVKRVSSNYPDLVICEAISPPEYFEEDEAQNEKVINILSNCQPDILFVALGSPRQEMWLDRNKELIAAKINIGLGSVFDYYGGSKKRSPQFMQRAGLEWMWRLINEPARLTRRYIINNIPFFIRKYLSIKFQK